jgi:N-acetylneuraminic acid mutarotase
MPPIPAPGGSYADPTWGTTTWRLATPAANVKGITMPAYSRVQAWNSDNTLMFIMDLGTNGVNMDLYDATTTPPTPINRITMSDGIALDSGDNDALWAFTDPHRIYYNTGASSGHGLELRYVDISACTPSNCVLSPHIVHTFSCATDGTSSLGAGVPGNKIETGSGGQGGMFDNTDTYFSFTCDKVAGDGRHEIDFIRYNRATDSVTTQEKWYNVCPGKVPTGCKVYNNFGKDAGLIRMNQHPDANYITVIWQAGSSTDAGWVRGEGVEVYDPSYNFLGVASPYDGHQDVGFDVNGVPVLVTVGSFRGNTLDERSIGITDLTNLNTAKPTYKRIVLPCSFTREPTCTGTFLGSKPGHISMTGTWGSLPGYALYSSMMVAGPAIGLAPTYPASTTLGTAVTAPGTVTVTPASMSQIGVGVVSTVDTGANMESVTWTAVTPTTATATFTKAHAGSAAVRCLSCGETGFGAMENFAVKIDTTAPDNSNALFWRIGRTMAIRDNEYNAEPHSAVNRDFSQIIWGSTWNVDPGSSGPLYGFWTKLGSPVNGQYALSTAAAGTGSGTITGCARNYAKGASYSCTVTAKAGSTLTSVSGCGGSGTATFSGAMPAADCTVTATFNPTAVSLGAIKVTPSAASTTTGRAQQFVATCTYVDSSSSDCTNSVTWSSSNQAAATITPGALASGVAAGSATIKATLGSIAGSGVLTVTARSLTGVMVTPTTASIVAGTGTQQYAARCSYSNGTSSDCTSTVIWSSSNPAAAKITTGAMTSVMASGVSAGRATIKATSGSIIGSSALTVRLGVKPAVVKSGMWAWIGGSSTATGMSQSQAQPNTILSAPSVGSAPTGREAAVSWTDSTGNLWLFGGGFHTSGAIGYLNDLWEFLPSAQKWVWVGGTTTVPAANEVRPGVYGTLDTPAAGLTPGGREASASWTDKSGNLWLFGGIGYDSAGTNGSLNDLWKFDPSTQKWTWMNGDSSVPVTTKGRPGVYGQLGVPAAGNTPGARWGASSWTDLDGNLWLFGGEGYDSTGSLGSLNDLWELDPSAGKWVWMAGSNKTGVRQPNAYGSFGSSSTTNVPSARNQAVSWVDSTGNVWLFGGEGYDSTGTFGYLNDLWEFNPSTRKWAWMGGGPTVGCSSCGMPGVYGTLGEADPANSPGGRIQAVGWTDGDGNLWLFGGSGYDSTGKYGILNDVWEFSPSTQTWAWMGGSSAVSAALRGEPGLYGPMGVASAEVAPGSRWGTGGWTDSNGNLWLFGGEGYDSSGVYGNLDDLWVYQLSPGN